MVILGIDPGLQRTGWAVIESNNRNNRYIASGVVATDPKLSIELRLLKINQGLAEVITAYRPGVMAVEQTYVNKNFESSLKLAHARAASILTAAIAGLQVVEYQAKTVKKTLVGSGKAEKDQLMRMLSMLIPGLTITQSDEADAIAIAICHAAHS